MPIITEYQYNNLLALSQKHCSNTPYLSMLGTIHALLYIVENEQHIRNGIEFYNVNYNRNENNRGYIKNNYFTSEFDWNNGVMRDAWQISFHINQHVDSLSQKFSAATFFSETALLLKSISEAYEIVLNNGRIDEFCGDFSFDSASACLQARVAKVINQDWSSTPKFTYLLKRFLLTLPSSPTKDVIVASYAAFWENYDNLVLEGEPVTSVRVLKYLEEYFGYNFSQEGVDSDMDSSPKRYSQHTDWVIIKNIVHGLTNSGAFYNFYFDHRISADDVHDWFRSQEALRPLGIMRSSVQRDESLQKYVLMISKEQYVLVDAIHMIISLQHAARHYDSQYFCSLLQKTPQVKLDSMVCDVSTDKAGLMHIAAKHQPPASNAALIEKISIESLNRAISLMYNSETVLHAVIKYQNEEVVLKLLNKVTPEALETLDSLVDKEGFTILDIAAFNQSASVFLQLLEKMTPNAINKLMNASCFTAFYMKRASNLLEIVLTYQSPSSVNKLIAKMDIDILKNLTKLNPIFLKSYFPCLLDDSINHLSQEKIAIILALFNNYMDFFEKQILLGRSLPAAISQYLVSLGLSFHLVNSQGTSADCISEKNDVDNFANIQKIISEGDASIKIIRDRDRKGFLKQLGVSSYRPSPRNRKPGQYKCELDTGNIVRVAKKNEGKIHAHTKKISMTLISRHLNTAVFGEHDDDRELVGFLFNIKKCELKGLFSRDIGTFHKHWVDIAPEKIKEWKASLQSHHYFDLDKFKERIEKNPFIHNEMLAKVPYENIQETVLAIVIAKDTRTARKVARSEAQKVKVTLNIDLPVIFYDRFSQTVRLYTHEEQESDNLQEQGYESYTKMKALRVKHVLLDIVDNIPQHLNRRHGLVRKFIDSHVAQNQDYKKIVMLIIKAKDVNTLPYWFITAKTIEELTKCFKEKPHFYDIFTRLQNALLTQSPPQPSVAISFTL